jgi:hypothetical protein
MADIVVLKQYSARGDLLTKFRDIGGGAFAEVVGIDPSDETTGALLTIDTIHHEVHEGEMYHAEYSVASVANDASLDLLVTVGLKEAHSVFEVLASGLVQVYLYEAPTASGGTPLAIYNMKRASLNTALSTVTHTPTVSSTGSVVLVNGRLLPGGNSPQTRVGGGVRTGTEWLLAPSTKYLIRITNKSGAAVIINSSVEFYEE